jgi:hypothetical protein
MTKRKAPEPTGPHPDDIEFDTPSPGQITLWLDEKAYICRRPKIGEHWQFQDALGPLRKLEREDSAWAAEASEGDKLDTPAKLQEFFDEQSIRRRAQQEEQSAWWISVFTTLCGADWNIGITGKDLPDFLLDSTVLAQAFVIWSSNPRVPGGK